VGRTEISNLWFLRTTYYLHLIIMIILLGAFEKLWKAASSFVMSACPSARNNSAPTERIFLKFGIWALKKIRRRTEVSLKCDKNNRHFSWRPTTIYDNTSLIFLRMINVSDNICRGNETTLLIQQLCFPQIISFMR